MKSSVSLHCKVHASLIICIVVAVFFYLSLLNVNSNKTLIFGRIIFSRIRVKTFYGSYAYPNRFKSQFSKRNLHLNFDILSPCKYPRTHTYTRDFKRRYLGYEQNIRIIFTQPECTLAGNCTHFGGVASISRWPSSTRVALSVYLCWYESFWNSRVFRVYGLDV